MTTRRRFLRVGIGAGALLGAGALAAHWFVGGYRVDAARAERLVALSPKELRIVDAVLARVLRADVHELPAASDVEVGLYVDGLVARLDDDNASDLKSLLHVIEHVAPLSAGKAGRFSSLEGEAQDDVLRSLERSSVGVFRGGFEALRTLGMLAYFRHPTTWPAIGYDGPWVGRAAEGAP